MWFPNCWLCALPRAQICMISTIYYFFYHSCDYQKSDGILIQCCVHILYTFGGISTISPYLSQIWMALHTCIFFKSQLVVSLSMKKVEATGYTKSTLSTDYVQTVYWFAEWKKVYIGGGQ